jgi:hypothetical protein
MSFRWFNIGRGQPWVERMWTLKLVTFVVSGTSTGGVGTTTASWIFPAKLNVGLRQTLAGADQINASRGNHPNRRLLPPNNGDCR